MFKPRKPISKQQHAAKIKKAADASRKKQAEEEALAFQEEMLEEREIGQDLKTRRFGTLCVQIRYAPSFEVPLIWEIRKAILAVTKYLKLSSEEIKSSMLHINNFR